MKKILAAILGVCMFGACCVTGCGEQKHTEHTDADNDGVCDVCKQPVQSGNEPEHTEHTDANNDGKCDECGATVEKQPEEGKVVEREDLQTDSASFKYVFEDLYKKTTFVDADGGFNSTSDIKGGRFFVNGKYYDKLSSVSSRQDVKVELYNDKSAMMINVSAGMAFTIPATEIDADYTIAQYRTQYMFDDSVLTFSAEDRNPYTQELDPWYVFVNEWAIRHLVNMKYYENQNLTLLNKDSLGFDITPVGANGTSDGTRAYPTVKHGDLEFRKGYDVYRFDIKIEDAGDVEYPYYHIGIIREKDESRRAGFFVLKAKENRAEVRDSILKSWRVLTPKGKTRNYFENKDPVPDPHWNAETKAFFEQFMTQKTKSWGVFSYSMPGEDDRYTYNKEKPDEPILSLGSLKPNGGSYNQYLKWSRDIQHFIEETAWGGKKYDVYMTYTHLGSGAIKEDPKSLHYAEGYDDNRHHFPLAMAKELAGGNGDGTKPVLEFTFQFTTNNNLVDQEITPLFDIMRGKYDTYFARLAKDIKEYGKPVMFRLNNEMNTDWTSYSGIMNLLDPDIFTATWKRLYNVFIENGVDNVIWVWNPIADSCPYSGWGEDLCYFPGFDYVQLLGGTNYEANNDRNLFKSFKDRYGSLYEKNKNYFEKWGMIIGEFACGSGGNASGELGRNRDLQEKWVKEMFDELNSETPAPYAQQIKGLIWFNCNDYSGSLITNRYKFADIPGGSGSYKSEIYTDLEPTWKAFQKGFADAAKLK